MDKLLLFVIIILGWGAVFTNLYLTDFLAWYWALPTGWAPLAVVVIFAGIGISQYTGAQ